MKIEAVVVLGPEIIQMTRRSVCFSRVKREKKWTEKEKSDVVQQFGLGKKGRQKKVAGGLVVEEGAGADAVVAMLHRAIKKPPVPYVKIP